jgi:heterodisulfide reductase subunit A
MTQLDLEIRLETNEIDPKELKTVVMIQCAGSRIPERTYCSRICCTETVKNALELKQANPELDIYVLYKDMRTYGFREEWFREAREKGVLFLRHDNASLPEVVQDGKDLKVSVFDQMTNKRLVLRPDRVVLAVATLPAEGTEELAKMLKVPQTKDKFLLEAHMKLRPLDFATDGVFLCGLIHGPKFIEECISHASGAVSRACTILSKGKYEVEGVVSRIDPEMCVSCGTCIDVCPVGACVRDPETGKAVVIQVQCKGCGTCASACPQEAIIAEHFTNEQILAQIRAYTQKDKADEKVVEKKEPAKEVPS